jgi:lipopolysaccharide export LptBFGC system permease protein LptF
MMLLDRYIIRQYLTNIVALMLILGLFVVTIDASLNLNKYWERAAELTQVADDLAPVFKRSVLTPVLVMDLWWPRLLNLFNFLLGMVLVAAMGFTCSQLVRHRELVAVLTSGQSLYRVGRPLLMVAVGLTLVQGLNQEFLMPRVAPLLTREIRDAGRHTLGTSQVALTDDGFNRLFYAREFDSDRQVLTDLYIWERDERGIALRRIHAPEARWRDGGWDLHSAQVTPLAGGRAESHEGESLLRIETDLDPTRINMNRNAKFGNHLSFAQTAEMLRRLDRLEAEGAASEEVSRMRDRLQRVSLGRISAMLSNILTLMIAMVFFITREPRNMVWQSLKCAPIAMVALVGGVVGASVPLPGVPTVVSVFLPVMVLAPIALAMVSRVRT